MYNPKPGLQMHTQSIPEIEIHEGEQQDTAHEPFFRVIIHNDDVTPMGFVVYMLTNIFILSQFDAVQVMLTAHYRSEAVVQILPKSEAEKRINKAHFAAGLEGYPLHFSLEAE
jgi:ATP-dependent Clp protease adaptor protein ClpS